MSNGCHLLNFFFFFHQASVNLAASSGSFPSDFFFYFHLLSFYCFASWFFLVSFVRLCKISQESGQVSCLDGLATATSRHLAGPVCFLFTSPSNFLMLIFNFLTVLQLKEPAVVLTCTHIFIFPWYLSSASKKPFRLVSKFSNPSFQINSLDHGYLFITIFFYFNIFVRSPFYFNFTLILSTSPLPWIYSSFASKLESRCFFIAFLLAVHRCGFIYPKQ